MKIDRLETHDRFKEFVHKEFEIGDCAQDIIDKRPFGNVAFYLFAHARTEEDGHTKRLIWQPRLTRPKAQSNSMLFKVYPGSDQVRIIWMIPDPLMWKQYAMGNITENAIVLQSIHAFQYNRASLEQDDPDDLNDAQIDQIYRDLSSEAQRQGNRKTLELPE